MDNEAIDKLWKVAEARKGAGQTNKIRYQRWNEMLKMILECNELRDEPDPLHESHLTQTPLQPKKQEHPPGIPHCSIALAVQKKERTNAPEPPTQTLLEYLIQLYT